MTIARFYVHSEEVMGEKVILQGEAHHHLSRVLRMRPGQEVVLLDGMGLVGRGDILEIEHDRSVLKTRGYTRLEEETPRIRLFQGIPQGRKMDGIVQGCVELGVCSINPFACVRSLPLIKVGERKIERWRKIAIESSRVAGRAYLPSIEKPLSWEGLLGRLSGMDNIILADEEGSKGVGSALREMEPRDLALVIGPEGGLTAGEKEQLFQLGSLGVTLGRLILRAETAGMVMITSVRCRLGSI